VDSCEHGNETSGLIKGGEFLNQLRISQILNKDFYSMGLGFVSYM
jgi:hypothetical protein